MLLVLGSLDKLGGMGHRIAGCQVRSFSVQGAHQVLFRRFRVYSERNGEGLVQGAGCRRAAGGVVGAARAGVARQVGR